MNPEPWRRPIAGLWLFLLVLTGLREIRSLVQFARSLTRWSALTLQWYGRETGIRSSVDLLGPNGPQRLLADRSLLGSPLFAVAVATGCNGLLAWAQARRPAAVTPRGAP